jgi:PAS domain S-box-containing protein
MDTKSISNQQLYDVILSSITEGVFTIDENWCITSFNSAAEKITGISSEDAVGQPCHQVLCADVCDGACPLRRTLEGEGPINGERVTIVDARGKKRPISISTAILSDDDGVALGGVEIFRDLSSISALRKELTGKYRFEDIISRNHKMQGIFDILPLVAESPSTVLIEGESGTGKELVARALHNLSCRNDGPFVAVNCGALPDSLLESELFGHRAGAFTDARQDRAGRILQAQGGTLFLDEIADISPAFQIRLLRFLQERFFQPLGADKTLQADVRVIVATNRSLEELVEEGKFRQDLFYRINIVHLQLPPLRERLEDIPLLVTHFIEDLNALQNRDIEGMSSEALACLMSHGWPGNVRELENVVERAFIFCRQATIEPEHLPTSIHVTLPAEEGPEKSLKQVEAAFLLQALKRNGGNRVETARQLGIHKTTLYRRLKSLGVALPPKNGGQQRN